MADNARRGLAVLLTCQISPPEAIKAINVDVMLFLLGMFIIGQSLDQSGYLAHLAHRYFRRARSLDGLVLLVLFGTGFLSAILMNDTLAIIGTPVNAVIGPKKQHSASHPAPEPGFCRNYW
jgi:Na+/H+ antiporter NhaD/arsenite permease-like protein